jgi:hypothetical protein
LRDNSETSSTTNAVNRRNRFVRRATIVPLQGRCITTETRRALRKIFLNRR